MCGCANKCASRGPLCLRDDLIEFSVTLCSGWVKERTVFFRPTDFIAPERHTSLTTAFEIAGHTFALFVKTLFTTLHKNVLFGGGGGSNTSPSPTPTTSRFLFRASPALGYRRRTWGGGKTQ